MGQGGGLVGVDRRRDGRPVRLARPGQILSGPLGMAGRGAVIVQQSGQLLLPVAELIDAPAGFGGAITGRV